VAIFLLRDQRFAMESAIVVSLRRPSAALRVRRFAGRIGLERVRHRRATQKVSAPTASVEVRLFHIGGKRLARSCIQADRGQRNRERMRPEYNGESCWSVWASQRRYSELRIVARAAFASGHAYHAVVLAIPSAARGQVRLALRCQREE